MSTGIAYLTWNPVPGVENYWIDVGTSPRQGDIASGYVGHVTSVAVNITAWLNGGTIYIQLYSKFPGVNLITGTGSLFHFATIAPAPANPQLISPAAGTTLSTGIVYLTWNAVPGAENYWIDVGTSPRQGDIASGYVGNLTSVAVNITAWLTGGTIYVQLYSKFPGVNLITGTASLFHFATAL